jgi:hypothetical protein
VGENLNGWDTERVRLEALGAVTKNADLLRNTAPCSGPG